MKNGGKFRDDVRSILERSDSYWASKATEDTLRRYVPQEAQTPAPIAADSAAKETLTGLGSTPVV
jgi:hypothetical protein